MQAIVSHPAMAAGTFGQSSGGTAARTGSLGAVNNRPVELATLLTGREGWRLEVQDHSNLWCFGVDGAARLVVTARQDGFVIYRADQDSEQILDRIEAVEAWLDEHEHEHAGLTPLQEEYKRYLEQHQEPGT
jgi:hypothetical protein